MKIKNPFSDLRNKPVVSYSILAICGILFLALNLMKNSPRYETILHFLAPGWEAIRNGNYWGPVTSAFVHIETLHLFFNLSWVAIFGRVMEPDLGKIRYIALIVVSAAVSSLAQVLFSSQTGIGFSGIVYAFFGFAVAVRRIKPVYGSIADGRTIAWMSAWTIICLVMTYTGEWNIGNAAHISGFLFGLLVGKLSALRLFRRNVGIGLLALSALTLAFSQLQLWDGRRSVTLAIEYCVSHGWKSPIGLDTLAAAYAETNQWRNAIRHQEMAIRLLGNDDEMIKSFSQRLAGYRKRTKARF